MEAILEAHRRAATEKATGLTDDAAVAIRTGIAVGTVLGSEDNVKITTFEDMTRAHRTLAAQCQTRTGQGMDVHAFDPNSAGPIRMGGITIPHDRSLRGHSDADVVLHAITDALLGAIGDGDIGTHFPPSQSAWSNADSALFLRDSAERVARRGGSIANIDVTVICESPRIGPHRRAMCSRIAEILGIPSEKISVKATTTEGLGAIGRGEGIAAQALATIQLEDRT